ncbi:ubiquitin-specific protease 10 [Striga asiatica]|uniref:Ubiquitin-specific protease 10 n=1 Tax=Striga asiatica TaxID=4170 RepID=A0A5A7Q1M3_STRAF|nr:ubiquitin-specific protease 10 [Striga asiatica]
MEMIGHATKGRTLIEVYVVGEIIEEGNNEEEVVVESASRSDEQFDVDSYRDNVSNPKNLDDVGLGAESQKDGGVHTEVRNNLNTPQLLISNLGDCEVESESGDDNEDEDYFPVDESSSDDELSVDDLASDDDGLNQRPNISFTLLQRAVHGAAHTRACSPAHGPVPDHGPTSFSAQFFGQDGL